MLLSPPIEGPRGLEPFLPRIRAREQGSSRYCLVLEVTGLAAPLFLI